MSSLNDDLIRAIELALADDWDAAHNIVQQHEGDSTAAWIHAVLHKIEGDALWQHFQEIAKDHQNGVFAGTDNTVERITGKRPISFPDFLQAHRSAFGN